MPSANANQTSALRYKWHGIINLMIIQYLEPRNYFCKDGHIYEELGRWLDEIRFWWLWCKNITNGTKDPIFKIFGLLYGSDLHPVVRCVMLEWNYWYTFPKKIPSQISLNFVSNTAVSDDSSWIIKKLKAWLE